MNSNDIKCSVSCERVVSPIHGWTHFHFLHPALSWRWEDPQKHGADHMDDGSIAPIDWLLARGDIATQWITLCLMLLPSVGTPLLPFGWFQQPSGFMTTDSLWVTNVPESRDDRFIYLLQSTLLLDTSIYTSPHEPHKTKVFDFRCNWQAAKSKPYSWLPSSESGPTEHSLIILFLFGCFVLANCHCSINKVNKKI